MRQCLPDLLGDERHEGMNDAEDAVQDVQKDFLNIFLCFLVISVQSGLAQFDIPVAVGIPDEIIDLAGGNAQLEMIHVLADFSGQSIELGKDPAVFQFQFLRELVFVDGEVHHDETAGIPDLVAEVPHGFAFLRIETHVVSGRVAGDQVVAQRIGAVLIGHVQRIDAVAQRLGHLSALGITHQAVDEHGLEGFLLHLLHAGEDHAGHPEEDDVVSRDHDAGGIPVLQFRSLIRPSHGGKRPQCGGEPGIQNVFLTADVLGMAVLTLGGILTGDGDMAAVIAVPCGDLMTPPQLTGDTPVAAVLHPVHIDLGKTLGNETDLSFIHDFNGRFRQRFHLNEPLGTGKGFHDGAAAVAAAHVMAVVFHLDEIALFLQITDDGFSRLIAVHAVVLAAVDDPGVLIHDDDLFQIVAETHFIVVGVMAGGHLHRAGTEAQFHVLVGNDGKFSSHQRQDAGLAHEMLIALIIGMDGNAAVTQHGLRTGRGDGQVFLGILDGILDVPEMTGHIFVFHFRIRQRGAAVRTPVDDTSSLIDKTLLVQIAEGLPDRFGAGAVHGEGRSGPVAGSAQHLLLLHDTVPVFLFPVPDTVQELFSAEVIAGKSFIDAKFLFHLDLRGDAGVVGAGEPCPDRSLPGSIRPASTYHRLSFRLLCDHRFSAVLSFQYNSSKIKTP